VGGPAAEGHRGAALGEPRSSAGQQHERAAHFVYFVVMINQITSEWKMPALHFWRYKSNTKLATTNK
jgi:hypothetical protein